MKTRRPKKTSVVVTIAAKPPVKLGKILKTPPAKRAVKFPTLGIRDEIEQTGLALQTK